VPGVCRPVPFYERACRQVLVSDSAPLVSLIAAWASRPACAVGAAM